MRIEYRLKHTTIKKPTRLPSGEPALLPGNTSQLTIHSPLSPSPPYLQPSIPSQTTPVPALAPALSPLLSLLFATHSLAYP